MCVCVLFFLGGWGWGAKCLQALVWVVSGFRGLGFNSLGELGFRTRFSGMLENLWDTYQGVHSILM